MKKILFTNDHHEWQWRQRHWCGHTTFQAVLDGKRPTEIRNQLGKTECPKCRLASLMTLAL